MSIRSTKFVNEIIPLWKEIESLLKDINVKGLSTDDRNEIAHSKKVVAYFSGMLDCKRANALSLFCDYFVSEA